MTPDGIAWLVNALDSFHDFEHKLEGYPDMDGCESFIQNICHEVDITAPAAGVWDFMVFNSPFINQTLRQSDGAANGVQKEVGGVYGMGLINVAKADTGGGLFRRNTIAPGANYTMAPAVNLHASLDAGRARIVALGFELHDNTAAISKQGTCTVYRSPQFITPLDRRWENAGATQISSLAGVVVNSPPATKAQASLIPNSRSWSASQGAYVMVPYDSTYVPVSEQTNISYTYTDNGALVGEGLSSDPVIAYANISPIPCVEAGQFTQKVGHFATAGAIFTGLHPDAVFTLKMKITVERFPDIDEALISSVSPSPCLDMRALALYSKIVSTMPVGCPVGDNAKGDWWYEILRVIKAVAPGLGIAVQPIFAAAPAFGAGIAKFAGAAQRYSDLRGW